MLVPQDDRAAQVRGDLGGGGAQVQRLAVPGVGAGQQLGAQVPGQPAGPGQQVRAQLQEGVVQALPDVGGQRVRGGAVAVLAGAAAQRAARAAARGPGAEVAGVRAGAAPGRRRDRPGRRRDRAAGAGRLAVTGTRPAAARAAAAVVAAPSWAAGGRAGFVAVVAVAAAVAVIAVIVAAGRVAVAVVVVAVGQDVQEQVGEVVQDRPVDLARSPPAARWRHTRPLRRRRRSGRPTRG